ncbi:MAG TPA: helix-turn-helix transcriptional regulator [Stellaceae bacterium]|nr:helix-turn-helix transcriptional regulator [Stellaceae bacterium]
MPRKTLPRIITVTAARKPSTLRIEWDRGGESLVDVSASIEKFRIYEPLRHSPELFSRVKVGEYGADIIWSDEIDMSADLLWHLAQEQSGATMSAEEFSEWRERQGYTLDAAAKALGISRRMVAYYESGDRPVPRVVALATKALRLDPDGRSADPSRGAPVAPIASAPALARQSLRNRQRGAKPARTARYRDDLPQMTTAKARYGHFPGARWSAVETPGVLGNLPDSDNLWHAPHPRRESRRGRHDAVAREIFRHRRRPGRTRAIRGEDQKSNWDNPHRNRAHGSQEPA